MAILKTLGRQIGRVCTAAYSAAVLPSDLFACPIPESAKGMDIIVMELSNQAAVNFLRQHRHPRDVIRTAAGARWRHDPTTVCVITRDPSRRSVFAAQAKSITGQMLVL